MPYWQVESILLGAMAVAGMAAGFRALVIDVNQRRWAWAGLNALWFIGAMFVGWFVLAADLMPSNVQ